MHALLQTKLITGKLKNAWKSSLKQEIVQNIPSWQENQYDSLLSFDISSIKKVPKTIPKLWINEDLHQGV